MLWIFSGLLVTFAAGWSVRTAWSWALPPLAWLLLAGTFESSLRRTDALRARAECLARWQLPPKVWRRWWSLQDARPPMGAASACLWAAVAVFGTLQLLADAGWLASGWPALLIALPAGLALVRADAWLEARRLRLRAGARPEVVLGLDGAVVGVDELVTWNTRSSRLVEARFRPGARPSLRLTWRNIQPNGPTTLHELHLPVPRDRELEASQLAARLLEHASAERGRSS